MDEHGRIHVGMVRRIPAPGGGHTEYTINLSQIPATAGPQLLQMMMGTAGAALDLIGEELARRSGELAPRAEVRIDASAFAPAAPAPETLPEPSPACKECGTTPPEGDTGCAACAPDPEPPAEPQEPAKPEPQRACAVCNKPGEVFPGPDGLYRCLACGLAPQPEPPALPEKCSKCKNASIGGGPDGKRYCAVCAKLHIPQGTPLDVACYQCSRPLIQGWYEYDPFAHGGMCHGLFCNPSCHHVEDQVRNPKASPAPIPADHEVSTHGSALGVRIQYPPTEWMSEPITEVNQDGEGGGQLVAINAGLTAIGYGGKMRHAAALAILKSYGPIGDVPARKAIGSIRDLTKAEAHVVLSWLEHCGAHQLGDLKAAIDKEVGQPCLV